MPADFHYRFPDDFLFDTFCDTHHDDLLETECYAVAQRLADRFADLYGESVLTSMLKQVEADAYRLGYSESDAREIISSLPDADYHTLIERFRDLPDLALPFIAKSYDLKMFAMIGSIDAVGSVEELQHKAESVVLWAERLARSTMSEETEPYFCFFSRAARARLDLDLGKDPQFDAFACLASLARHPLADPITRTVLDTPRKTIQNLISSKSLERVGEDRIRHAQAFQWMSKQWSDAILFPSVLFSIDKYDVSEKVFDNPVFVPHVVEVSTRTEEPFLPMHGNPDGFHLRTSEGEQIIPDFWAAIDLIKLHPTAKVKTRHEASYSSFSGKWSVMERKLIEDMIKVETGKSMADEATLSDQCARLVARHPNASEHRKGHSKKLYRFRISNGNELAIEKRQGRPLVYILAKDTFRSVLGDKIIRVKGPDPVGRNSNLDAMDAFVNQPLFVLRPETIGEMEAILSVVLNEGGSK